MAQTQPEATTMMTNHVAIRIDDDGASSSFCCAVCMEPSEWVTVGMCGHREVCLHCAVRMRFFQDDRRCCICRALCATVVVIRANYSVLRPQQVVVVGDDGSLRSVFSETSLAFDTVIRLAGTHYCWWYHAGMAAYFDDRALYEAARNMCSPPLSLPPAGVGDKHHRAPLDRDEDTPLDRNQDSMCFLQYLVVMALVGTAGSIPLVMHYLKNWLPRVAVVIGSGLLSVTWAYFDSKRYS